MLHRLRNPDASKPLPLELAEARAVLDLVVRQPKCTAAEAAHYGARLLGCYRARDFADPEVFAAGVTRIFMEYAPGICEIACDPMLGLPRAHKFPPAMAEIADWLEAEAGRLDYYGYRIKTV